MIRDHHETLQKIKKLFMQAAWKNKNLNKK